MAPHSSTLAWQVPWTEEPGGLQSMGSLRVGHTEWLHFHFSLSCIGEGNGNPLQCSCLENPRDGGACWAAVYGVAQSRTRLKRLSSSSNAGFTQYVSFNFKMSRCTSNIPLSTDGHLYSQPRKITWNFLPPWLWFLPIPFSLIIPVPHIFQSHSSLQVFPCYPKGSS